MGVNISPDTTNTANSGVGR